jgi:D-tyrosyl-tRNA(Tyr) deacylase
MRIILSLVFTSLSIAACNDRKKETIIIKNNKISLKKDTVNIVKLSDTLVIHESTCRGCAFESSTAFAIKDSLDVVKLLTVETTDNNSPEMNGGSISKNLILVPIKTGTTILKMYKFWQGVPSDMSDSLPFTPYKIEIRN